MEGLRVVQSREVGFGWLAFVMAETPDAQVVNLEHFADGMTTDSPATVAVVNERLDTLRTEAYRGSESLKFSPAA